MYEAQITQVKLQLNFSKAKLHEVNYPPPQATDGQAEQRITINYNTITINYFLSIMQSKLHFNNL